MQYILTHPLDRRLTHPVHHAALGYWVECGRRVDGTPGRQDIDPIDIPEILPWVSLIDVHRQSDGLTFRHRLVGTAVVEMRNRDSTGLWFHETYGPETLARAQPALAAIVETAEPDLVHEDLRDIGRPYRTLSSLVLPLASDRRRVDMLMALSQYE